MHQRKATAAERLRLIIYKYAYIIVATLSIAISYILNEQELMETIIKNATTLAVTGAGISAFLFTIQSILMSIPMNNPFMKNMRTDGRYLTFVHRFCRLAEIGFIAIMVPMLFMDAKRIFLNIIVFAAYVYALLFTIWSMYLMGSILINCEKHSSD